jgi:hypothetical protein
MRVRIHWKMKVNPDQVDSRAEPLRLFGGCSPVTRLTVTTGENMMDSADRDYFLERAEAELDLANAANHQRAAQAHYYLAGFYLDRAYGGTANEN